MADIKISQLGEALAVTDNDVLPMTASGVTNKVKASTMKDYMVGDSDISALGDGSVTGAILNVKSTSEMADSNIAETMAQNGAHNLLPFPYYSGGTQVITNVTVTVNSNGTLTASGTASGTGSFYYLQGKLPKNDYKIRFVGTLSGVAVRVYDATAYTVLAEVTSSGTDVTFEIDATNENHTIWIYVEWDSAGAISINGGTLLRLASDPSTEYAPYAMTNRELTDGRIKYMDITLNSPSTDTAYGGMYEFDYRMNLSGHTVLSANIIDYSGLSKMVMLSAGSDDILRIFSATNGSIATSLDIRIAYI